MLRAHNPPAIHPPFARYSHAIEVPAGARLLFVSGQLGIQSNRLVPDSAAEQTELCFHAIRMILAEAAMTFANVVRVNAFVTDRLYMADYMAVRDRFMPTPPPASTLMIVSGFTRSEFKVEVEVVAADPA